MKADLEKPQSFTNLFYNFGEIRMSRNLLKGGYDSTFSWCRFLIGNRGPTFLLWVLGKVGRWGKEEWVSGLLSLVSFPKSHPYYNAHRRYGFNQPTISFLA